MTLRDRLFLFASAVGNRLAALWAVVNTLAPLDSPYFTGLPKAPTPAQGADHSRLATVGHVVDAIGLHTHPAATLEANGLFTPAEKQKLMNIEEGANLYVHPSVHTALEVSTTQDRQFVTQAEKDFWNDQLVLGESSATAHRGDQGRSAYLHSVSPHAPSDAQKNADITKEEIEAALIGEISTHSHPPNATRINWDLPTNMNLSNGSEIYHITQVELPAGVWEVFYEVQFKSTASGNDHYIAGVRQEIAAAYTCLASGQATGYGLSGHFAKVTGRVELTSTGSELFYLYGACLVGGIGKSIIKTTDLSGLRATGFSAKRIA